MRVSLLEINGDVLELEHMKLCRLEMHSFDSNNQLQPHVSNTVVITKAHRVGAGHRLIDDLNWSPFLLTPPPPPGLVRRKEREAVSFYFQPKKPSLVFCGITP